MAIGLRGDSTELRAAPIGQALAAWPDLAELLETAWASRPDLRAAELSVQAGTARVSCSGNQEKAWWSHSASEKLPQRSLPNG